MTGFQLTPRKNWFDVESMTPPISALETEQVQETEAISFKPVNCLLSLEELSDKVQEQVAIAWNGPNA